MYRKFFLTIFLAIFLCSSLISSNVTPSSLNFGFNYAELIPYYIHHSEENFKRSENKRYEALLAGFYIDTDIDPLHTGTVINWENGEISWIIKISSPGAPSLAVFINQLSLSPDSKISVFPENNPKNFHTIHESEINSEIISFPVMNDDTIIVEYTEKNSKNGTIEGFFVICDLMIIYKGLDFIYNSRAAGTSKECQVNINCSPEGDNWQNHKRSVARMIMRMGNSAYLCTGSLVNNANYDGTLYFLSAYHCAGDATASDKNRWQFYFDYEQPGCENTIEPNYILITGCTQKAKGELVGGSDFQLLLLTTSFIPEWKPYFNGWDRNEEGSFSGVCIHHPDGDAKKISTYNTRIVTVTPTVDGGRMAEGSAWQTYWASTKNGFGITEGGSSGSPLYNSNGLLIGTLTGGISDCNNQNSFDVYGKFNFHWDKNGETSNSRLSTWLDPDNIGINSLAGFDPDVPYHNVTFLITNRWDMPLSNVEINIQETGGSNKTDIDGEATFMLPEMIINYELTHNIHHPISGQLLITGKNEVQKISLEEDLSSIFLFPHRFINQVNIANAEEVKRIRIYNLMGQFIKNFEITDEISIDVSFLRSGLYLFVTEDVKGKKRSFRMFKQ